jgi:hypothetical protein
MSYRRGILVVSDKRNIFNVSIKVKVGPVWITMWREECAADDDDQIEYLKNCAVEVADKLIESV